MEPGLPVPGFLHVFVQAAGILAWLRDAESVAYCFGVRVIVDSALTRFSRQVCPVQTRAPEDDALPVGTFAVDPGDCNFLGALGDEGRPAVLYDSFGGMAVEAEILSGVVVVQPAFVSVLAGEVGAVAVGAAGRWWKGGAYGRTDAAVSPRR